VGETVPSFSPPPLRGVKGLDNASLGAGTEIDNDEVIETIDWASE